jgi:hypothetical protein
MQNKTFYNFVKRLLSEEKINASQVGNSIKRSNDYGALINSKLIEFKPAARGGGCIVCIDKESIKKYFADKFPNELQKTFTAISNVNSLRNTKAGKRESQNVILIRGQKKVLLNGIEIDLKGYTETFGTFSASLKSLETSKVCLVENLDSYLLAERVIENNFVFVHTYGGIGKSVVSKISANEILIFSDYDFKGLHTYLMVKSAWEKAKLFVPANYDSLFETKSRTIKTKQGREQQPSKQVLASEEEIVVKIRTNIFKHKKFLEQQALFK